MRFCHVYLPSKRSGLPTLKKEWFTYPQKAVSKMKFKSLIALGFLGTATLASGSMLSVPASAMPIDNLANVGATNVDNVDQVRLVCGRYRCWWRPGFRFYGSYGAYGRYGGP